MPSRPTHARPRTPTGIAWGTPPTRMTTTTASPIAEEQQATPPTDPGDARSFLVRLPPAGTTTLVVDAASALPASQRLGTPEAPYRALSEALQALRTGSLPQVHTVQVRAGTYAALTTQERFPLDLSGLAGLTLRGEGHVVIDAGLTADVVTAAFSRDLIIEGLVITRGVNGMAIQESTAITIRDNQITENNTHGISIRTNATGIVITDEPPGRQRAEWAAGLGELGGHGDAEYHAPEWRPGHEPQRVARHDCGQSLRRQWRARAEDRHERHAPRSRTIRRARMAPMVSTSP